MEVQTKSEDFRQAYLGPGFGVAETFGDGSFVAPNENPVERADDSPGRAVMVCQDNIEFMRGLSDGSMKLIVTSPPYNLGKSYEKRSPMEDYLHDQEKVIEECVRLLDSTGSLCWQVGNYVEDGEVIPLDVMLYPLFNRHGLKMRNRIVWHFGHGPHSSKRLSGRYETINWFTKTDDYTFNLDPIRVPSKYPNKRHFKGPNIGKLSGNPKGKTQATCGCSPTSRATMSKRPFIPASSR